MSKMRLYSGALVERAPGSEEVVRCFDLGQVRASDSAVALKKFDEQFRNLTRKREAGLFSIRVVDCGPAPETPRKPRKKAEATHA